MIRGGVDDLREQLFAEAQRHGLAQAAKVLVVADGALWIWNLTGDRFAQAQQRLDYCHASQHLWAVAHALHPEDETQARTWVAPPLQSGRAPAFLNDLQALAKTAAPQEASGGGSRTELFGEPPRADGLRPGPARWRTAGQ